jgi:hypothetical protein
VSLGPWTILEDSTPSICNARQSAKMTQVIYIVSARKLIQEQKWSLSSVG